MANVLLNVSGNGYAYTDAVPPLVNGEVFNIYSIPYAGETLDDIRVWDSHDNSIAITVGPTVTLTYSSAWGNVYVDIYFSGAPIPPPEPPKFARKFPWLLAKAAQRWRIL